jgi:hypothetical protein
MLGGAPALDALLTVYEAPTIQACLSSSACPARRPQRRLRGVALHSGLRRSHLSQRRAPRGRLSPDTVCEERRQGEPVKSDEPAPRLQQPRLISSRLGATWRPLPSVEWPPPSLVSLLHTISGAYDLRARACLAEIVGGRARKPLGSNTSFSMVFDGSVSARPWCCSSLMLFNPGDPAHPALAQGRTARYKLCSC